MSFTSSYLSLSCKIGISMPGVGAPVRCISTPPLRATIPTLRDGGQLEAIGSVEELFADLYTYSPYKMEAHADVEDYCVSELYRDCRLSLANGNILHTIRSWKVCVMLIVYELISTIRAGTSLNAFYVVDWIPNHVKAEKIHRFMYQKNHVVELVDEEAPLCS
ncbi:hypothetical protein Cgig2_032449 [Carnegiea gigantea]|uniref:Uncharacterized protein n=1 Tax=Carnegiea gigantea TaxID=171969 RepID=A0A9Q1QQW0_9CARY|nr:hypothetical protein Cgig2_032449 [Carnegiea gigantea]